MEKLIELVVKCQKELKQGYPLWDTEGAIKNSKEILISKSFGFIKRLVDNDKIGEFSRKDVRYPYYLEDGLLLQGYGESDSLIMLLAISDNPIEDLISYLN